VVNGGAGRRRSGFSSTELTRQGLRQAARSSSTAARSLSQRALLPFLSRPVSGSKSLPRASAHHAEPHRDALHAARRQPAGDPPPEQRRQLVAEQPIDDSPALLSPDEVVVDAARSAQGFVDRLVGDLVKDDPSHRDVGLQQLDDMPADALAFAILIGREQQLVGSGQLPLELRQMLLLVPRDDVERLETAVDVDTEPCPGLLLEPRRNLVGALRQVAYVAVAGLHLEVLAQDPGEGLGLGRRFDDYE
jgi:hypothetical protein